MDIDLTIGKGVIYKFTSPSNKSYIGQSINFPIRYKKYKRNSKESIGKNFYHAINKYNGIENFELTILALIELSDDVEVTKRELDLLEIYYIEKFDTFYNGYNLTAGGGGSFKREISLATREKLSKSNKGKNTIESIKLCCPICNKEFFLKPFEISRRTRKNKSSNSITCSRPCGYEKLKKIR